MKLKNRHLAVVLFMAGMATVGCSQQQAAPVVETVPEPAPVVEYAPAPQPEPVVVMPAPAPAPVVRPAPVYRPKPVARPVVRPPVKVPPVKAKGNYRGAIQIDRDLVQQYQY